MKSIRRLSIQDWVHKTGLDMFIPHHWDDGTNKEQFRLICIYIILYTVLYCTYSSVKNTQGDKSLHYIFCENRINFMKFLLEIHIQ